MAANIGRPYTVIRGIPAVETYRALRAAAGLSAKTIAAAEAGLPHSVFAVQVLCDGVAVGMGRLIGDRGLFYQVVDVAVLPAHQGRGLGKAIMAEIAEYIAREVPESAHVSLLANGEAYRLYQQFGFSLSAPGSVGMQLRKSSGRRA